jgi:hypothetical protein
MLCHIDILIIRNVPTWSRVEMMHLIYAYWSLGSNKPTKQWAHILLAFVRIYLSPLPPLPPRVQVETVKQRACSMLHIITLFRSMPSLLKACSFLTE